MTNRQIGFRHPAQLGDLNNQRINEQTPKRMNLARLPLPRRNYMQYRTSVNTDCYHYKTFNSFTFCKTFNMSLTVQRSG